MSHKCKGRYLPVLFQGPSSLAACKEGRSGSSCQLGENQEPNGNTQCSAGPEHWGSSPGQPSMANLESCGWKRLLRSTKEVRAGGLNVLRTAWPVSRARKIHHNATTDRTHPAQVSRRGPTHLCPAGTCANYLAKATQLAQRCLKTSGFIWTRSQELVW